MSAPTTWYIEDILRVPTALLWRNACRQGLFLGPQVFLYFLVRKIIGWRFRAPYGVARPSRLPAVSETEVPRDVFDRISPIRRACVDAGMTLCFMARPPYIGGRSAYSAVFLDRDGTTFATVTWLRVAVGRLATEQTVFVCQSRTMAGTELVTQALEAAYDRPDTVMPSIEILPVPPSTSPPAVIASHSQRIAPRADLVRFDCDSLAAHGLKEAQRWFDWRIEKGLLVPLTPREVRALGG